MNSVKTVLQDNIERLNGKFNTGKKPEHFIIKLFSYTFAAWLNILRITDIIFSAKHIRIKLLYKFQLLFWFLTYSILIASTTVSIVLVPPASRKRFKPFIATEISVLLIVFSVSAVYFLYSYGNLYAEATAGFLLHFLFHLGLSSASFYILSIPKAVFPEEIGNEAVYRFLKLIITVLFFLNLLFSVLTKAVSTRVDFLIYSEGVLQLGILAFFFASLVTAVLKIAAGWNDAGLKARIAAGVVSIVFIITTFGIDIVFGLWYKLKYDGQLSLFYVFPIFLSALSGAAAWICIYFSRVKTADQFRSRQEKISRFGLSQREIEVAFLIAEGLSYQETADRLYISLATVQSHIKNIYRKTGVNSKIELANLFRGNG